MTNNIDYNQLLQKPIAMMTGEELTFLIKNCASNNTPLTNDSATKELLWHRRNCTGVWMQCSYRQSYKEKWCHR